MAEPLTAHAVPFSRNRRAKIKNLLVVFAIAFISLLPIGAYLFFAPMLIFYFPAGLLFLLSKVGLFPSASLANAISAAAIVFVWLFLLGISATIVMSNNMHIVRRLFGVLILLLIVNTVGWYYQFVSLIN